MDRWNISVIESFMDWLFADRKFNLPDGYVDRWYLTCEKNLYCLFSGLTHYTPSNTPSERSSNRRRYQSEIDNELTPILEMYFADIKYRRFDGTSYIYFEDSETAALLMLMAA
jgi:hypothetical protein